MPSKTALTKTQKHTASTGVSAAIPRLRFPGFEGEVSSFRIQDLIDLSYITGHLDGNHGELYPKADEFSVAGIPYIAAKDLINGLVDFSTCKYVPLARASAFKKGIAKNGDVLFAHNATVGPVAILRTSFDFAILSTTVTYFRCDSKKLSNYFLYSYFQSDYFIRQYTSVMFQTTRSQLPITIQRRFSIRLPEISEQQKIASFLTTVDSWIDNLRNQKSELESYKRGLMQQLFSQQIRFWDDNGNEFPVWEEKTVREIVSFLKDGTHGTHEDSSNSSYLLLSAKNIKNGLVLYDESDRRISEDEFTAIQKNYKLQDGDILLSIVGTIGNVAVWSSNLAKMAFQRSVAFLRFDKAWPTYMFHLISSYSFQAELKKRSVVSAQPGVYLGDIAKIKIKAPSITEQQKIAELLTSVDQLIESKQHQISLATEWKKGLMQGLFI